MLCVASLLLLFVISLMRARNREDSPMMHRRLLAVYLLLSACVLAVLLNPNQTPRAAGEEAKKPPAPTHAKSAAYEWLNVSLEATAREHERKGPRPTVGSRMLAIIVTAMYDA